MVVALTSPCRRFSILELQDLASADSKGSTGGQDTVVILATVMEMVTTTGDVVEVAEVVEAVEVMEGVEEVNADRAVNHMEARCTVHTRMHL